MNKEQSNSRQPLKVSKEMWDGMRLQDQRDTAARFNVTVVVPAKSSADAERAQ